MKHLSIKLIELDCDAILVNSASINFVRKNRFVWCLWNVGLSELIGLHINIKQRPITVYIFILFCI